MKDLVRRIITASNIIANNARKGSGNFMVVSPKVAETINNLDPEYRRKRLREERRKKLDKINEKAKI